VELAGRIWIGYASRRKPELARNGCLPSGRQPWSNHTRQTLANGPVGGGPLARQFIAGWRWRTAAFPLPGAGRARGKIGGFDGVLSVGKHWLVGGAGRTPQTRSCWRRGLRLEAQGATRSWRWAAAMGFSPGWAWDDQPRPDAGGPSRRSRPWGWDVAILSGVSASGTPARRRSLPGSRGQMAWGACCPEQNWKQLGALAPAGPVRMVGDGSNECPCPGRRRSRHRGGDGTQIAQDTADLVYPGRIVSKPWSRPLALGPRHDGQGAPRSLAGVSVLHLVMLPPSPPAALAAASAAAFSPPLAAPADGHQFRSRWCSTPCPLHGRPLTPSPPGAGSWWLEGNRRLWQVDQLESFASGLPAKWAASRRAPAVDSSRETGGPPSARPAPVCPAPSS